MVVRSLLCVWGPKWQQGACSFLAAFDITIISHILYIYSVSENTAGARASVRPASNAPTVYGMIKI